MEEVDKFGLNCYFNYYQFKHYSNYFNYYYFNLYLLPYYYTLIIFSEKTQNIINDANMKYVFLFVELQGKFCSRAYMIWLEM